MKRTAATGVGLALAPYFIRTASAEDRLPYIQAFPSRPSVAPGETFTLHVSTEMPEFRVSFYRVGYEYELFDTSAWLPGTHAEPGRADLPFKWPGYEFTIPREWPSGAYLLILETQSREGTVYSPPLHPYGTHAKALLVVRRGKEVKAGAILYKLPTNTYHAYNHGMLYNSAGRKVGGNLFENLKPYYVDGIYAGNRVTMLRPGGGTGGDYEDGGFAWGDPAGTGPLADPYKSDSRRASFAHWDAPMIAWLDRNRYLVDFCTDLDIHEDAGALLNPSVYKIMISAGHDAFWSLPMRDNIQRYVHKGGNVALFTGETGAWRVHYIDDHSFYCNNYEPLDATDRWWDRQSYPENTVVAVANRNAGRATGEIDPSGYTVQESAHWVFGATGLGNGQVFGADERLVNYVPDGARFQFDKSTGKARLDRNSDDISIDQAPYAFRILGYAETSDSRHNPLPGWSLVPREEGEAPFGATMGLYTNVGNLFVAGTPDWARLLDARNPDLEQITHNVLKGFGARRRLLRLVDVNIDHILEFVLRNPVTGSLEYWALDPDDLLPRGGCCFDEPPLPPDMILAGAGVFEPWKQSADLLFQSERSGEVTLWQMNGSVRVGELSLDSRYANADWQLLGAFDLDKVDRESELPRMHQLLFHNAANSVLGFSMLREGKIVEEGIIEAKELFGWSVVGLADFDGDGQKDILWTDGRGQLLVTLMVGRELVDNIMIDAVAPQGWTPIGTGALSESSRNDILFTNVETGEVLHWQMDGFKLGREQILELPL